MESVTGPATNAGYYFQRNSSREKLQIEAMQEETKGFTLIILKIQV
jgi:hypothetical protein